MKTALFAAVLGLIPAAAQAHDRHEDRGGDRVVEVRHEWRHDVREYRRDDRCDDVAVICPPVVEPYNLAYRFTRQYDWNDRHYCR